MARDPYRYFRIEARELLDQLGKGALELDKGAPAPELIASMLRLAHTLKGAARIVKQREIAEQAHAIEDALATVRETGKPMSRDTIDAILHRLDQIALGMSALTPQPEGEGPTSGDSGAMTPSSLPAPQPGILEPVNANVDEIDGLLNELAETSVQLAAVRSGAAPLQRGRQLAQLLEEHLIAPRTARLSGPDSKLHGLVAELRGLIDSIQRGVGDGVEQMDRQLRQARETAERLRLLPASFMFGTLERTLRDAAQGLGKRIALVTSGGEVRLEAEVFRVVQSALVQAVRNAVAHGIESEAQRKAAGKPAEGRVWIEVERRGHRAVFVCRDDGQGVDLDAVRRAIERKNLRSADSAAKVAPFASEQKAPKAAFGNGSSHSELLQVLLGSGISTSTSVTQHAGRGIGLDIVREAASRLGGTVSIRTDKGMGTTLEIIVPVSLAVVDALIVETGGRAQAIPLDAVKRTLRIAGDDLAQSAQGASILFEGKAVPFAPLGRALRQPARALDNTRSWSAVVIEGANALAAVGVERLRGTQNLVLRPLPAFTPSDPVVAGASLDAEGHPQLVLDPDGLVEHVCRGGAALAATPAQPLPILVIDDSLTTRMLEQSILESAGYEVDLATSGEDGLERARARRYALFLVDVEMPGMDGFAFIERVRADPMLHEIPAILVTSRASPEDRQRGKSVGARGHIVKGEFDQTELLEKIRSLVGVQ